MTETLANKCYRILKQEIAQGKYAPGDCIVENDVCKAQGVSKATAGEVLHRLTQEGVLKSYPRKGYVLNAYSREDFLKIQNLRFAIESLVLRRLVQEVDSATIRKFSQKAAGMSNHAFHLALCQLLKDDIIENTLENLLVKAENAYNSNIRITTTLMGDVNEDHRKILNALLAKDERAAVQALREDLQLEGAVEEESYHCGFTTASMDRIVYVSDPQISPDGKKIAYTQYVAKPEDGKFYASVMLLNIASGQEECVSGEAQGKHPRFLDGKKLAFLWDQGGEFQIAIRESGQNRTVTSLRHGVKNFCPSGDGARFVLEADLWENEVAQGLAFTTMFAEEKREWLEEREWAPMEITAIDYKRDECYGVRDGSVSYLAVVDGDGQRLLTEKIPHHLPVWSPDGQWIACYAQPYTGCFFSANELFVMDASGQNKAQLTHKRGLCADVPPCFAGEGESIVYPAWYFQDSGSICYLYKIDKNGGEPVCLFDPEAEEICSGVYASPGSRTQFGAEKPYFTVSGNQAYFTSCWGGRQGVYKISLKGNSAPKAVLSRNGSIHEFCLPVKGSMLLTCGDYHSIRELYLYDQKAQCFTRVKDSNPWLQACILGAVEEKDVPSRDGKAVIHGRIVKPVGFEAGKKYPAVLYIHGGPEICYTNDFWHEFQILANAGFVVVSCDPRGSSGYGLKFQDGGLCWEEEAMDDLLGYLDAAIAEGYIDENRLGVTGGSYGGYTTCKLIMRTKRFAAAVGQRIFVNSATSYGTGDIGFYSARMPWSEVNIQKILTDRARSTIIRDMDKIETPLLLLHGYRDYRCSFEQAEQMFISMKERRPEVPVRLVMFPGENHGVTRTGLLHFQKLHIDEMVEWFTTYLKGDGCDEA